MITNRREALHLALAAEHGEYAAGTLPSFRARIRNTGDAPIKICVYMLRYRLMAAMNVTDERNIAYALFPFRAGRLAPMKPSDLRTLGAGESLEEPLALSEAPGWGFVRDGSLPPVIPLGHIIPGFGPGTYRFSTMLFGKMAIYVGQDNVYDHHWRTCAVPDDLPGARKLDVSGTFRGEMEASAKIAFVTR